MTRYTVRSSDTSVQVRSALDALKEVQKLAVYEIASTVFDENMRPVTLEELRAASHIDPIETP